MSKPTAAEMFRRDVPKLEGDYYHTDTQGIPTLAYGIALHVPENKKWAESERVKHGAGRYQDIPKEIVLDKAVELFMREEKHLRIKIPEYDSMSAKEKYLLLNARYNTGQTFVDLSKALIKGRGSKNPHADGSLHAIYNQTSRKEGGVRTKGMDNRSLKELNNSGYYDPYNEKDREVAKSTLPMAVPSLIDSAFPNL